MKPFVLGGGMRLSFPIILLLLSPSALACSASIHLLPVKDAYAPGELITLILEAPGLFQAKVNLSGVSYLLEKKPLKLKAPDSTTPITTQILFGDCSLDAPKVLHIAPFYKPNSKGIPITSPIPKLPLLMTLLSSLLAVLLIWRR